MASSDEEGDTFPDAVSGYIFYNKDDKPISFSKLPVQWSENESSSANARAVFLDGYVDNGLGKFYRQVKAWKYDILKTTPVISVLSKDNYWIKLEKPKKCYEKLIRTILISVHCLCFLKRKPEASRKSLWDHLSKVFSLYDVSPSENDLVDHVNFIREAVKRDEALAKSKFLAAFLDNPRKRKSLHEDVGTATKPSFIVDDMNDETQDDDIITNQIEDSLSDEEDDPFDSVCAICDNGGSLTCCEGACFRSFHATPDAAQDSICESLCLTSEELEDLDQRQYKCENCKYSLHQCFVCAEIGSSDKSSNTEVFRCCSATCGHFYHPECVAKLLQRDDEAEQHALKVKIVAGEPFICPAHKCAVCKLTENEKVEDLQFSTCRRCPKSYHRKCLPSDIMFEHQIGDDDDDEVRAWNGLLPKSRALIYCVILAVMKEAASCATLDEVKRYHWGKVPSTHALSSRVDKTIILARVEGYVEAVNLALKKLKEGCSVEDAKAICEPGVITQLMRWKVRLRVYLAPFLHGMRYTSFGRHFTKVEKLEKIVEKLQWYIEDGDMVVDFCCGANDFSCLMKKRLDEMGKKCSYKNYDITQPKKDFNFEKRDWMTVSPNELPSGSRLIMGLNPPFGVNASLANKFIDKALQFRPKLIILIVPPETERLDGEKRVRGSLYNLVWKDVDLLAGKSFYLPGSVDVNGKQVDQWNNTVPPLYLWSRPDWTKKHKSIAQQRGHTRTDDREEKTYQNSSKKNRHGQESKVDKHDDRDAYNQTHAQKLERARTPVEPHKHEKRRVPSHEPGLTSHGPTDGTPYNRTNTSARQRYAPMLDELNHTTVNNSGWSEPGEVNRARMSGVRWPEPPMGSRGVGSYGAPLNGPGSCMNSLGFAPGLDQQYSQHNSSGGWLDE